MDTRFTPEQMANARPGADRRARARMLEELALRTGGAATIDTNNPLPPGSRRVARDSSHYYFLELRLDRQQARWPVPPHRGAREAAGPERQGTPGVLRAQRQAPDEEGHAAGSVRRRSPPSSRRSSAARSAPPAWGSPRTRSRCPRRRTTSAWWSRSHPARSRKARRTPPPIPPTRSTSW